MPQADYCGGRFECAYVVGSRRAADRHSAEWHRTATYGSLDDSGRATFDVAGVLPLARPAVRICVPAEGDEAGKDGDGSLVFTGLAFHGVPSGHEFNSFVLGLYNAAGPGQPLGDDLIERAKSITDSLNIMILSRSPARCARKPCSPPSVLPL